MKPGAPPSGPLLGIAEVHDLSYAYQVEPLLRLLSEEADLLPDLLRARPWLAGAAFPHLKAVTASSGRSPESAKQVLETLLEEEWSGFLARLGRLGPWVFAPTVADLQALSGAYTTVVEAASRSDLQGCGGFSLLGRLNASGELTGQGPVKSAEEAEAAFWALAERRAAWQRNEWAGRRQ